MFLEEGLNVKVVLLPDGEDPDSFANSHNASDFIEYIKQHQTDFIRFKGKLLSEDAGNDPQKRAELIKNVVESIAQIPDPITRQVYIKDSADKLEIQEPLLIREVNRLRRAKITEKDSKREETNNLLENNSQSEDIAAVNLTEQKVQKPLISSKKQEQKLDENFRNLLQLIIRYGEHPLYQLEDGSFINTGSYIIMQLQADSIEPPLPLYQKVMDEFVTHNAEPDFVAENFFKFHPDNEISALAVDLIADKYQLSRIFSKQSISENVVQEVGLQTDADHLTELVPQLLLELKYTIINIRIDKMTEMMKDAQARDDWELMRELLIGQPALLEIKNQISRQLGNRVITL